MLARLIGPGEGRDEAAADRRDVDDSTRLAGKTALRPKQRQKGLSHDQLADRVDLQHLGQFGGRLKHQGTAARHARVVDQPEQRATAEPLLDQRRRLADRCLIGDVELQRREIGAELAAQPLSVRRLAHAAEDLEALSEQLVDDRPADARRRPGNDDYTLRV